MDWGVVNAQVGKEEKRIEKKNDMPKRENERKEMLP